MAGQDCFVPAARGCIWDLRRAGEGIIEPLDFSSRLHSRLDVSYVDAMIPDWPDQRLLRYLHEGFHFEFEMPLQIVLHPHLFSVGHGYASLQKEARRLRNVDPSASDAYANEWTGMFASLPFMPIWILSHGSTPRKLEPDRHRSTTEGGAPRCESYDTEGVPVRSINERSREYPHPPEVKPTPAQLAQDVAVLNSGVAAAQMACPASTGLATLLATDDAADYFMTLATHPSLWFYSAYAVTALPGDEGYGEGSRLRFVVEYMISFGIVCSSNFAQRFSLLVLALFEAELLLLVAGEANAELTRELECFEAWLAARRAALGDEHARLHTAKMYTDDAALAAASVELFILLLRAWSRTTRKLNLRMAIALKRYVGASLIWLGVGFAATAGLIFIPRSKVMRTLLALQHLMQGRYTVQQARSLLGLLEHLKGVLFGARSWMYGLWALIGADPGAGIELEPFQQRQARRWQRRLQEHGMISALSAFARNGLMLSDPISRSSDAVRAAARTAAAGEARLPQAALRLHLWPDAARRRLVIDRRGLGVYCHGLCVHVPLTQSAMSALPIGILELLAAIVALLTFCDLAAAAEQLVLHTDSLSTAFGLGQESASTPEGQLALDLFLHSRAGALLDRVAVLHCWGEGNPLGDAASRDKRQELYAHAAQLGVRIRFVRPDAQALGIIRAVHRLACRRLGLTWAEPIGAMAHDLSSAAAAASDAPALTALLTPTERFDRPTQMAAGRPERMRPAPARPRSPAQAQSTRATRLTFAAAATAVLFYEDDAPSTLLDAGRESYSVDLFDQTLGYEGEGPSALQRARQLLELTDGATEADQLGSNDRTHASARLDGSNDRAHASAHLGPTHAAALGSNDRAHATSRLASVQAAAPPSTLGGHSSILHAVAATAMRNSDLLASATGVRPSAAQRAAFLLHDGGGGAPSGDATPFASAAAALPRPPRSQPEGTSAVTFDELRARRQGLLSASTYEGPYALRPEDPSVLAQMDAAMQGAVMSSANPAQLRKDMGAWNRYWEPICSLFRTPSIRDVPGASTRESLPAYQNEVKLLCFALILILSVMQPRSHVDPAPRPRSGFQVLLQVRRVHQLLEVPMVPFRAVRACLNGLLRQFIRRHGAEALIPRRKKPMHHGLFMLLLSLTAVRVGTLHWTATGLFGHSLRAVICLMYVTGFRKAELVDHGEGLTYLTRSSLRWCIRGVKGIRDPTAAELRSVGPGDYVEVWPRQSKCDFTGEVWGDKPVFLHWSSDAGNACAALVALELLAPVHGTERLAAPLLCDEAGRPLSETLAQRLFDAMLLAVLHDGGTARQYSWHSFRHGLATRLRQSDCPADVIMQICRWQTIDSLRTYAQLGADEYKRWLGASYTRDFTRASPLDVQIDSAPRMAELAEDDSWDKENDGPAPPSPDKRRRAAGGTPAARRERASADLPRLDVGNAKGRLVLVPSTRYKNKCTEHGGRGWEAIVQSATGTTAVVRYLYARTPDGRRYEDTREPLDLLEPLT